MTIKLTVNEYNFFDGYTIAIGDEKLVADISFQNFVDMLVEQLAAIYEDHQIEIEVQNHHAGLDWLDSVDCDTDELENAVRLSIAGIATRLANTSEKWLVYE